MVQIQIKALEGARLPAYATVGSAGADICAYLPDRENLILEAGTYTAVPTGLFMALPSGFEAQIRPRSGLAAKHGVTVLNAPGTIDADYRGEIRVLLINLSNEAYHIQHGERIAQMIISPVAQSRFLPVDTIDDTERGAGGFGSTGK
ncbi:MAG: dUTP diphosphatase [Spirochaetota bacterium]